ncbi:hypothetical protein BDZ89DRAFT_312460 [Hymenopellis radicata]|nr:hypothetical protein BDZ89DRAFT_312460 [Hymenopellis radicata]
MHHPLIASALRLAGIKLLTLTGNIPANKRQQVVDQFRNDRSIRVLLMSDVGAEGLNLNFVTCMIIYDVGWTAVQTTQLKGRLHRKGQTKPTFVFQLVGRNTIDSTMIMSGILKKSLLSEYLMRDAKTALAEYKLVKLIGTDGDAELVRSSYGFDNSTRSHVESLLGSRKRSEKDQYPTDQPELARFYVPPQQDRRLPPLGEASGSGTTHTGMTRPPPSPRRTPQPSVGEELSRPGSPMVIEDRAPSRCSSQDDADRVEQLLRTIPDDISDAPDALSRNIRGMLLEDGPLPHLARRQP